MAINNEHHRSGASKSSARQPASSRAQDQPVSGSAPHAAESAPISLFDNRLAAQSPYQVLVSCLGDLVLVVGRDGCIQDLHCPEDYEFGLSAEGLVGKRIRDLLPTQLGLQAMHYLEKALRHHALQVFSSQYNLPGRVREFQVRLAPCGSNTVLAVVRDVTDRRYFEKELLEVNHRIQMRIGQDLHDGLGQHLTGITFLSKALENKLSARDLPEAAEAAEIARLVIQALAQTRHLARSLFPAELESEGLVPALKELAATMRTLFKLSCVLECDPNVSIPDAAVANHLFRLTQEAVNNAIKHGRAHQVIIKLRRHKQDIVLSVADDGTGFDPEKEMMNGLGMRIMRYRAKKIGGQLEIHAAAAGGTQVTCTIRPQTDPSRPAPSTTIQEHELWHPSIKR